MSYNNTISTEENTLAEKENTNPFFSPSSIVAIFNAATVTKEEKKIIQVRGIFKKTGTVNYQGYYYNSLKDEAGDNSITLLTSALMHNQLEDNKTIEFNGFITRRVEKQGRIQININLVELLAQRVNKFSEEETQKIILINKKVEKGFKDLDAHIKNAIFHNKRIVVKVIMGRSAIIDSDIKKAMEAAITLYDIEYHRISLSAPGEITSMIRLLDNQGADLICVARGGGENLEIFENPEICESIINAQTIIASAIGHAQDVTLFEKLADKKFITPTHFGNYLKEIYEKSIEEFEQSKAKLVHDITSQLSANYGKQIENLTEQLTANRTLHERTITETKLNYEEQKALLQNQLKAFEELASKTDLEKGNLYAMEIGALKQQVLSLKEQQVQKDRLIEQAETLASNYKNQLNDVRPAYGMRIAIIIIAAIIGLAIGLILANI
ncbi:MAG: exodeoxyribonuclease VII large subunit [Bacteroidota bacterium]